MGSQGAALKQESMHSACHMQCSCMAAQVGYFPFESSLLVRPCGSLKRHSTAAARGRLPDVKLNEGVHHTCKPCVCYWAGSWQCGAGGVSMGDKDFVKPLLEKHGRVFFGKVRMKPGKPLTFATLQLPSHRCPPLPTPKLSAPLLLCTS